MSTVFFTGNTLRHRIEPGDALATKIIHSLDHWNATHNGLNEKGLCQADTNIKVIPPLSFYGKECPTSSDITAKLFLPPNVTPQHAAKAAEQALNLYYNHVFPGCAIKWFIISLEGLVFSDDHIQGVVPPTNEEIAAIWKAVTDVGDERGSLIDEYGIAELSPERLKQLLARSGDIKPSVDHINASDCCALPPGLLALSKEKGIKLVAHHDPEEMLPDTDLERVLDKVGSKGGQWDWILRLTCIVKDRQVLCGNEYLVHVTYDEDE
jgi:glutamate--cysteine ligase regulatory subunit